MDRLQANQQLNANDELVSNSGWFRFRMFADGSFGSYRTQTKQTLWSQGAGAQPGSFIVMQGDGNFVAYAPDGTSYWATNTDGHPGASVVLQDDGNLVVYDAANHSLWASNTVQNLNSPTIGYMGQMGYSFNETSEWWKDLCSGLPCFFALQWPGYASDIVEDVIDGQPVVIQLWKGNCPKFLGLNNFPGGVGAEVGVYRRIPGHVRPPPPPRLIGAPQYLPKLLNALANFADDDLWWPFPELGAEIEFTLTNPNTNQRFFSAGPEKSYWLCKWMDPASYNQYQSDQGGNTPAQLENYILDYKINGVSYPQWSTGRARSRLVSAPAVTAWGNNRLDIFGLGTDRAMYHKWWDGNTWLPSAMGWDGLGGTFTSPPAVTAWGNNRLHVFGVGTDSAMYHKWWDGNAWLPSAMGWERLGGIFTSPPAVTGWANHWLAVFGLGTDRAIYTKMWDGSDWVPSGLGWTGLGGTFTSPPAVTNWGNNRVDIFGLGTDSAMYHKWWDSSAWRPSAMGWDGLGGTFTSPPSVTAWGNNRLDIFGLGTDRAMYHKWWDGNTWLPRPIGWDGLGGTFTSAPAVTAWGNNRLDIFGLGTDRAMYHKWWDGNNWLPSARGWESLGGTFIGP